MTGYSLKIIYTVVTGYDKQIWYVINGKVFTFAHSFRHAGQLIQLRVDDLIGFFKNANEIVGLFRVVRCEECVGSSCIVGSACASNAVNVVLGAVGEVKVDDELDIVDICLQAEKNYIKMSSKFTK